ncbi:MAG: carboxypeptidase-like regulatory domain-containing protein, partial [Bryobacteraceae bacterium]
MKTRHRTLIVFTLLAASRPILAQTDRGAIEGLVTDPSGAAVPNAQVQVVQIETNSKIDLATNELGMYFAPNLPLGSYRIILEKSGFRGIVREPVLIRAQTHARVDFTVQIGDVAENVSVTAEAPMLDISTTSLATGLTTQFIDQLPLILSGEKRNITQYLQFTPGTSSNDTQWTARVNGALPGDTEVFIDGAPAS